MASGGGAPGSGQFDAFISYSHENRPIARWLHQALEFFGRTARGRASRIFRDETNLGAGGALNDEIIDGLVRSRRLILLASPESAASPWVRKELDWWWERHHSYRDVIVVLVGGEISWDPDELTDLGRAAAVTTTDLARFGVEHLHVDLRERAEELRGARPAPRWWRSPDVGSDPTTVDALASIAATIRGIEKEVLVGNEVARQRRTRRRTQVVVSVLSAALVAAVWQANEATQERRVATARLLSSSAMLSTAEDGARARLLAVEGLRMHRDDLTLTALYDVADANPYLAARATLDGEVTVLEGSVSGRYVVAATEGTTYLWDTQDHTTEPVDLHGEQAVAADLDRAGERIAVATDRSLWLWTRSADGGTAPPTPVALRNVIDVGLSDTDDVAAVLRATSGTADGPAALELVLVDTTDGGTLRATDVDGTWKSVGVDGDDVVMVGHDGAWQRRAVSDLSTVAVRDTGITPWNGWIGAASPDAGHFGFVKYSVDVHRNVPGDLDTTYQQVPIPGSGTFMPRLLALSPDGSAALVGGNETWVTTVDGESVPEQWQLSGAGLADGAAFLNETRIVTAHGPTLVLWDLTRPTGPYTTLPYTVVDGPTVGFAARTAFSDDQRSIAVVGGFDEVTHGTIDRAAGQTTGPHDGLPVWRPDGSLLLATGNEGHVVTEDGRWTRRLWTVESGEVDPWFRALAARIVGEELYVVDDDGVIQIRDERTGTLLRAVDPGFDRGKEWNRPASASNQAAISEDGRHAAVVLGDASGVALVRVTDGTVRTLTDTVGSVLIDDDRVIVATGREVRTFTLDGEQTSSFSMTGDYADALAVVPGTDVLARVRTDGRLVLANLTTGRQLADYAMPVPRGTIAQSPWHSSTLTTAGSSVYSATVETDVARWDLSIPAMAEAACRAAGRDLSPQEWRAVTAGDPPSDLRCHRSGLGPR